MKKLITIKNICYCAIAICFIFTLTYLIKIPYFGGNGYFNFSDTLIIYFSLVLNPIVSIVASCIGSALADLASGYAIFILPTILAKGLESLAVILLFKFLKNKKVLKYLVFIVPPLLMVIIYFVSYIIIFGINYAMMSSIYDLIQSISAMLLSFALVKIISHIPLKNISNNLHYF